jgi:hypothetical protein
MDLTHFDFAPSVSFEVVASPHFVDLTIFPPLQHHEQFGYSPYTPQHQFLSQASYQFSQPTTPVNVPTTLNHTFEYDPNMGMSDSYSPVMDYGTHFPNQAYPNRNVPPIRLDTSFLAMGISPAHLTASSSTSAFSTPIRGLRQFSPFTSSPTSPLPQLNVSYLLFPLFVYKAPTR